MGWLKNRQNMIGIKHMCNETIYTGITASWNKWNSISVGAQVSSPTC